MSKSSTDIRQQLVAAGLRTVAFEFDGCGDSGSVNGLRLPSQLPTGGLDDYEDDRLDDQFGGSFLYQMVNGKYATVECPTYAKGKAIIDSISQANTILEDLAYAALEHFPGDWVNNEGGHGIVAVDLLTGEYRIDGWQRVSNEEEADGSGTFLAPIDDTTELNVVDMLKRTLE